MRESWIQRLPGVAALACGTLILAACGAPPAEPPVASPPAAQAQTVEIAPPPVEPRSDSTRSDAPPVRPSSTPVPTVETARPTETPARPSAPESVTRVVPAGTLLGLEIVTGASSETGTTGDSVRGRVSQDIAADGVVLIPAGAVLHGTIAEAVPTKKFGGTAKLTVAFRRLELPNGQNLDVSAGWSAVGKSQTKKDAATIGGAAAGGALLGKIIGGQSKDAAIGAAVGAAAGTAVAAKNKTDPVELRVGARIEVNLDAAVTFTTRS